MSDYGITPAAEKHLQLFARVSLKMTELTASIDPQLFFKLAELALQSLEGEGVCKHDLKAALQTFVSISKSLDKNHKSGTKVQ